MNQAIVLFFLAYTALSEIPSKVQSSFENKTCDSSIVVSEKEVMQLIFQNYSRIARPRRNASMPVEVTLGLHIRGVHDLIERENTLILDGFIEATWHDDYLTWESSFPLSCIRKLVAPPSLIWLPDLAIVNAPNGIFSLILGQGFGIDLFSNGSVYFAPGGQIVSQCEFDVTYFPFDVQRCQVNFEAWSHDIAAQTFKLDKNPFLKVDSSWTENRQWSIEANFSFMTTVRYNTPVEYPHAHFTLILHRKALFYLINIIVPSVIISVVELATFALPIDEVTKIHISFTCLLAYSVFQGMAIADLPRSGDSVPLLSLYIDLQMAYIGLIALMGETMVFLVIRKAKLKKRNPSPKVVVFFGMLARILCVEHDLQWARASPFTTSDNPVKKDLDDGSAIPSDNVSVLEMAIPRTNFRRMSQSMDNLTALTANRFKLKMNNAKLGSKVPVGKIRRQWMLIAEVVERFNIILYISATTITPLVMFLMIGTTKVAERLTEQC